MRFAYGFDFGMEVLVSQIFNVRREYLDIS